MAGTAPTETRWLLVEHAGPWGRRAVAESRLPDAVRTRLATLEDEGVRVQLVRRPGSAQPGSADPATAGATVLSLDLSADRAVVREGRLDDVEELLHLDPDTLPVSVGPLLLVCTNGRRDVCCAEVGRPVAAALAQRWPRATWETTHLGGHRFAGTLLVLPVGLLLGRVRDDDAVAVVEDVLAGRPVLSRTRGRAGRTPSAQAACLDRAAAHRLPADAVTVLSERPVPGTEADRVVRVRTGAVDAGGTSEVDVLVRAEAGVARRLSCVDEAPRPTTVWTCEVLGGTGAHARRDGEGGAA